MWTKIAEGAMLGGVCLMWLASAGGATAWYAVYWPYLLRRKK